MNIINRNSPTKEYYKIKFLKLSILAIVLGLQAGGSFAKDAKFFYCGYTGLDGSSQDYSRWGKGTDFVFNTSENRWEWISEFTSQFIYPNGDYKLISHVDFFPDQKGLCNLEMEKIYTQKTDALKKSN